MSERLTSCTFKAKTEKGKAFCQEFSTWLDRCWLRDTTVIGCLFEQYGQAVKEGRLDRSDEFEITLRGDRTVHYTSDELREGVDYAHDGYEN